MALKSALITGGKGNLGYLPANNFENIGIHVISYDTVDPQRPVYLQIIIIGNIPNSENLRSLLEKERSDTIVHRAGLLSGSSEVNPIAA